MALRQLQAGYGERLVLDGVDLALRPGEVLALIGPNGSGKSTLIRAALGLIPLAGGQVVIDGVDAASLTPRQRAQKAAYLPQTRPVPNITALRMVLHGRFPHLTYPRRFRREDYGAAMDALERADAAQLAQRPMPELSGGQRQRVYLAMALAQDAQTVFLDEPTAFLDVGHQHQVGQLARGLAQQGRAVALVLHDLPLALTTADRLAVLDGGPLSCWLGFCWVYYTTRGAAWTVADENEGAADEFDKSSRRSTEKPVYFVCITTEKLQIGFDDFVTGEDYFYAHRDL